MTTLQTSRFPTNDYIKAWTERLPLTRLSGKLQIVKLDSEIKSQEPEAPVDIGDFKFPLKSRLFASRISDAKQLDQSDLNGFIAYLKSIDYTRLNFAQQYRIEREIKKLRGYFPFVTLGSPLRWEIVIKTKPLTIRWEDSQGESCWTDIGAYWVACVRDDTSTNQSWLLFCRPVGPPP